MTGERRRRQAVWAVASGLALLLAVSLVGVVSATAQESEAPSVETPEQDAPDVRRGGGCCGQGMHGGGGCCGHCGGGRGMRGGSGRGPEGGGRGPAGAGRGAGGHRSEMWNAHALISAHEGIERQVEDLINGTRTKTTAEDPELVAVLQRHVAEMAALIEDGGRIRNWDPLFATIFNHREAIEMEIENIPNGVIVTETSDDPQVAALIRAHAAKVDDFVARGGAAYRESTPLPEEYLTEGEPVNYGLPCFTEGP